MVSKFEAEHRDEILEILELIDHINKWYMEKNFPEIYQFRPERLSIHFKDKLVLEEYSSGYPIDRGYNQLNYFKKIIRAYQGRDEDAVKYVKKVKALIDKPLDEIVLGHVRLAMAEVKCPAN